MQQPPDLPAMKPVSAPAQPASPAAQAAQPAAQARSAPVGARRLRQAVSAVVGGGLALTGGTIALQLIAKPGLTPADLMATIEAHTELGIFNQKMGAEPGVLKMTEADYQRALAKAQREGQAQAELSFQRDLAAVQADKERVVGAYQTLYQRANMIAQAALQLETLAQQMRQQLIQASNGGRNVVIMFKDIFCGLGDPQACQSARDDRGTMIAEADELSRGDVGTRVRELMAGIDDPASFIAHDDRRRNGTPGLDGR